MQQKQDLNLNAALCICGFYIDFAMIITYTGLIGIKLTLMGTDWMMRKWQKPRKWGILMTALTRKMFIISLVSRMDPLGATFPLMDRWWWITEKIRIT